MNGLALTASARFGSLHSDEGEGFGVAMTRSELIAQLAQANPHLRQPDVELIVTTIFDEIIDALARGDRVELRGFGAFSAKRRDPRTGRNPRTGTAVAVDGKAVPYFKPGKELRERVNGGPLQEPPRKPRVAAAKA